MKQNYKSQTKQQLAKILEELNLRIMQTYVMHEGAKEKKENRKRLRKEVARIKTELRWRLKNEKS